MCSELMRSNRMTGYLLVCLGSIMVLAACVFRRPTFVIINGHFVEVWRLILILGLVLASLGVVSLFRSVNLYGANQMANVFPRALRASVVKTVLSKRFL